MEILDNKYAKADLPAIVKDNCKHLTPSKRESLLSLLFKFEQLFDGTVDEWNQLPVSIQLKEGAKPFHGRPYPLPKVHKATLMKEIDRLVSIGVMKWRPYSQWALPSFTIPKRDLTVRTISDFRGLNKRIVSNTQNQYHIARARRLHVCNCPGFEHGLLYHQIRPTRVRVVHHHILMGQILLFEVANRICRFSGDFPSRNGKSDGIPGICMSIH